MKALFNEQLKYLIEQNSFRKKEFLNYQLDFLQTLNRIYQINQILVNKKDLKSTIISNIYLLYSWDLRIDNQHNILNNYDKYNYHFKNNLEEYNLDLSKDLIYTLRKTWATNIGSLGYYLNFHYSDFKYHVLSPSELGYYSVFSFLKQQKNIDNNFIQKYINLLTEESESNAADFYKISTELWQVLNLNQVFSLLNFFQEFLPLLNNWYFKNFNKTNLNKIELELYTLANKYVNRGVDFFNIKELNLTYLFIHQDLSYEYFFILDNLIYARKLILDNIKISDLNEEIESEYLLKIYLENISLNLKENYFRESSLYLLKVLAPPIGFNLYLVVIAVFLLTNSYNLIFKTDQDNPLINKFIYIAGYSLNKSNLNELKIIGNNLIKLSNLDVNINLQDYQNIFI